MTDETTVEAPAAPEAPASDDIGSIVRAAYEKAEAGETKNAPTQVSSAATPAAPDSGAAPASPAADPKSAAPAPQPGAQPAVDPTAPQPVKSYKMPVGWKHGADQWHGIDPRAKEFIAQREADYNKGVQRMSQAAGFGNEIASEFMPYSGLLNALGATPVSAVKYLLSAYSELTTGTPQRKAQVLAQIAADQGIDIRAIAEHGVPEGNPEVEAMRAELAQLRSHVQSQQQQRNNAELASVNGEIEAFANDPAHEHFEACRQTMVALLQGGQAKSLKDAYEQAVWLVPEVRASLVAQQQAQAQEKRKKEAEAAKRAGVSVVGAPAGGTVALGDMSLRDSIAAQVYGNAGRV